MMPSSESPSIPALSDFDYSLPRELIAAYPAEDRASARLLAVDRAAGSFSHHVFRDLASLLRKGDLVVLNDTKVVPARLFGRKETGGRVEALLLEGKGGKAWEALLRPCGRIAKGALLLFGENGIRLEAKVMDEGRPNSGARLLEFHGDSVKEALEKIGHIPLPPYIDRPDTALDRELYQTVFASQEGAVASPTAGLHFDRVLLDRLHEDGIEIVTVTLHVGYGTFQPVTEEDLARHRMFEEWFEVTGEAARRINQALEDGRRVIACGTTSVRALESAADSSGLVQPLAGRTGLFIYPPYEFKIVSGLITNFHLPKSSLLLLTAAFLASGAGVRHAVPLRQIYEEAIRERYRFYSYGDAMFIL